MSDHPIMMQRHKKNDRDRMEVVVPQELLPLLNQFPRILKPK
jgi:hypothetical protein